MCIYEYIHIERMEAEHIYTVYMLIYTYIYTRIYIRHLFYCKCIFIEMLAKTKNQNPTKTIPKKKEPKRTENKIENHPRAN